MPDTPDTTVLPTGGMSGGNSGGVNWLLVGGIGVGVVVLLLIISRSGKSAGQPTTSAGTSINAALGSIQEQNLNIMGEISQHDQRLSSELSNVNANTILGTQGIMAQQGAAASMNYYLQAQYYGQSMYATTGNKGWLDWAKQFLGATSNASLGAVVAPTPPAFTPIGP